MLSDSPIRARRWALTLLAVGGLTAVAAPPASAQPAGITGMTPVGDYLLEIDGADDASATIYGAQQAGALVILSSELPAPLMIDVRGGSVAPPALPRRG